MSFIFVYMSVSVFIASDHQSILSIGDHINEFVSLHAFDTEVPVTLCTPIAIDSFTLVESCDSGEALGSTLYLIAGPRTSMIGGVPSDLTLRV